MKLKIITPERLVVEETQVDSVTAKVSGGMLGILPRHAPLMAPLEIGVMHYVSQGRKHPLAVMGGLLTTTDGETVMVFSDAAELSSEIDVIRAQHAKDRAESELRQVQDHHDIAVAQQALSRALVRLSLASGQKR